MLHFGGDHISEIWRVWANTAYLQFCIVGTTSRAMPLLKKISLKIGPASGQAPLQVEAASVTLIVGPNNSGKSLLLRELNDQLREGRKSAEFMILDSVESDEAMLPDAVAEIQTHLTNTLQGQRKPADHIFFSKQGESQLFHEPSLRAWLTTPKFDSDLFRTYVKYNTIKLDGPNRIGLVADKPLGDLTLPPLNRLAKLFVDDATRRALRKAVHDALQTYLVLDPTNLGHVRVRLSNVEPASDQQERGIHLESINFHKNALYIGDASDGIKAFCGILIELFAGDPRVLIIDEPEAFLHPALAYLLGKAVATKARETGKQLIIATHSANFLMGCVQSGADVNVVRLTFSNPVATARLLPSQELITLMRNPLLRSSGVLNGMFYEGVVVTEGDTDRAFYNEINERLLLEGRGRGARNCLFLNAQNKQTVRVILPLLRKLGIPAAGIVDIDVLKEGGSVWTEFLRAGNVPELIANAHGQLRANLLSKFQATNRDMKRDGGVALLGADDARTSGDLLDALDSYGLFVVRNGEIESWLRPLGITGHGPQWLIPMFERLGENPSDSSYVHAANGDIWNFIDKISAWLSDPHRKGLLP